MLHFVAKPLHSILKLRSCLPQNFITTRETVNSFFIYDFLKDGPWMSPCHKGYMFHNPSIFLYFILFSSLIKPVVPFYGLRLRFPWAQKLLHCSLDSPKCLSLCPVFVCLLYFLFRVEESRLLFPRSQQSDQEFPCSLENNRQYPVLPRSQRAPGGLLSSGQFYRQQQLLCL